MKKIKFADFLCELGETEWKKQKLNVLFAEE